MKAAIFLGPKRVLEVNEVDIPRIEPDEILVRVAACGVCHTDLHYIDHGVPTFKKPPLILGHEASGVVEEVGDRVKNVKVGDRVLLPAVVTCGTCEYCRIGRENICISMKMFGNHIDGAYAEYVKAPGKDVFILPEEISLEEGCVIADAVSTPFHAVKNRGNVRPGDRVVVFGCGGVGMNVVQVAAAAGAAVIAVDIMEWKLELAKNLGASYVINARTVEDVGKAIRKLTGGGADVAFEAIGNPRTMETAFNSLKSGGRLVVIGYSDENLVVNAGRIMFREMEIVGSLGCRPVDYPKIIDMVRTKKIRLEPIITAKFKLDEINVAFDYLRRGEGIRAIVVA